MQPLSGQQKTLCCGLNALCGTAEVCSSGHKASQQLFCAKSPSFAFSWNFPAQNGRCQGQTLMSMQNGSLFSTNTAVAIASAGNREGLHAYVHKLVVLSPAEKAKPVMYWGILQIWAFMQTEILNLCRKNAISITKFNISLMNPIVEAGISINSFPATTIKIKSVTGTASGLHQQVDK